MHPAKPIRPCAGSPADRETLFATSLRAVYSGANKDTLLEVGIADRLGGWWVDRVRFKFRLLPPIGPGRIVACCHRFLGVDLFAISVVAGFMTPMTGDPCAAIAIGLIPNVAKQGTDAAGFASDEVKRIRARHLGFQLRAGMLVKQIKRTLRCCIPFPVDLARDAADPAKLLLQRPRKLERDLLIGFVRHRQRYHPVVPAIALDELSGREFGDFRLSRRFFGIVLGSFLDSVLGRGLLGGRPRAFGRGPCFLRGNVPQLHARKVRIKAVGMGPQKSFEGVAPAGL
jgi:hypothetical protein